MATSTLRSCLQPSDRCAWPEDKQAIARLVTEAFGRPETPQIQGVKIDDMNAMRSKRVSDLRAMNSRAGGSQYDMRTARGSYVSRSSWR